MPPRARTLSERGQQFYQPASALEMDILCSHHLVSCPSSSADYRKPNPSIRQSHLVLSSAGTGGARNIHPRDSQDEGAEVSPRRHGLLLSSFNSSYVAFARPLVIQIGTRPQKRPSTLAWREHCLSTATNPSVGIPTTDTTSPLTCTVLIDFALHDHMALLLNLWYAESMGRLRAPLTYQQGFIDSRHSLLDLPSLSYHIRGEAQV
jgi:hypothetical protein